MDQNPILMTHLILIAPVKAPSPNTITLRVRAATYEYLRDKPVSPLQTLCIIGSIRIQSLIF